MSECSAVIGLLGGAMRLRTSLPNFDAMTGPDAGMSFDSEWSDILKIHQIGIATSAQYYTPVAVAFPELGYSPFIEVRRLAGNVVYDDYVSDTQYGLGAAIFSNRFEMSTYDPITVLYAIYRVPVPAP
ncbi:hypothetical protein [Rhodopseudomonas telluris]|uniref:Uncharacterized protein n=1 Tax=Rhodopseudomonas telluris TaxID=644215 RepID=A0ABV6EZM8_9BRAD